MPRSLLDQLLQIGPSVTYDDAVASAHSGGTAEGQSELEGDLNILRTNMKDLKGVTNWFDEPDMSIQGISDKQFIYRRHEAGFETVSVVGSSDLGFDAAIKTITSHAFGLGDSTTDGVVVFSTNPYKLILRDGVNGNPIEDGSNNDVYGRLSLSTTPIEVDDDNNQLSAWASITGVVLGTNTDADGDMHVNIVDDSGGFFHVDLYSDTGKTTLVGHTATYNSTGSQAIVADGGSGLGGTITIDAVTAVDSDIVVTFGSYLVSFYSDVDTTPTAYTFSGATDIDIAYVFVSENFNDLPWNMFLDAEYHDISGPIGTIADDNVTVDGMTDLYSGLTTQAQVNAKGDDLGSTANGEGASLIAIEDASTWYSGTDIEAALNELEALLGSTNSTTYNFTENNALVDDDAVYAALEKLDLKWGDIASVANGEGASIVAIEDAGGYTTTTDVEAAIQELYQKMLDVSGWEKQIETTGAPITSGSNHTLPGGMTYTVAAGGKNLDVYLSGQLLTEGAGNDYQEVAGGTQIKFLFTVPTGRNLTYMARE